MLHLTSLVVLLLAAVPVLQTGLAPTGTLRSAFLATNPVQGRLDPKTGAVTGPVADLTRELARRLGVGYRIVPVPDATALIEHINTRQVDIGFLAYEAARAEQVDFSAPYALMGSAYMVRADSALVRSADVDRAGVTIAAVNGASQGIWVNEHVKNARVTIVPVVPPADAMTAMLLDGRVDAFAANRQRLEEIAKTSPRVRVLGDNFMVNGQAVVVLKGDTAKLGELNRFLTDVLASGFVKESLVRNNAAGVEVAPVPPR